MIHSIYIKTDSKAQFIEDMKLANEDLSAWGDDAPYHETKGASYEWLGKIPETYDTDGNVLTYTLEDRVNIKLKTDTIAAIVDEEGNELRPAMPITEETLTMLFSMASFSYRLNPEVPFRVFL